METISEIQKRLEPEMTQMNAIMRSCLSSSNPLLDTIVNTYLQTKGKQIRPLLVILSAKMFGKVTSDVLYAGAALEMLHNASLIHDDVVDETLQRRGNPTINAGWGNHIAVLTGDFFVANALAAGIKTKSVAVVEALSNLGKELSIGEIEQIGNVREHHFDVESYLSMIRKKTASLFRNCVRLGAETGGADPDSLHRMVEYAELLGICFQIRDDIFDYYDQGNIGKPTGNDLREGKVTLPLIYALQEAPEEKSREIKDLITQNHLDDSDIQRAIAFAIEYGGINRAYEFMRKLQQEADALILTYPSSECRETFREIFDFIIERKY